MVSHTASRIRSAALTICWQWSPSVFFAAQLGGRALWLVPATFVSVMALAGVAGMAGVKLPFVEIGIALSICGTGLSSCVPA
jgi:hydrogenase/urease accessory protein HupE